MIISYINGITPIAGCQEEWRVANLKFLERNGGGVVGWLGGWGVESGHEGRKQKAGGKVKDERLPTQKSRTVDLHTREYDNEYMAMNPEARDDDEYVSALQLERIERLLTLRILEALEETSVAQYIRDGHIEIIIRDRRILPSIRFVRDIAPPGK